MAPVAPVVLAQDADEDRGFLTEFLEEKLSGLGREVRITGFEGALSSEARIGEMTIADADGVWLTIRDATLSWNRSALLRGRVEVGELSAAEIVVARRPVASPDPGLPDAEVQPFSLPELPVSVAVDSVRADSVSLDESLFGRAVEVSLTGNLRLAGGEGEAALEIVRIDGTEGRLALTGAYANDTGVVTLDLSVSEPQNGIAATMLGLPGRPAIDLDIDGSGPLSAFDAQIRLASDGQERLAGTVTLREGPTPEPPADGGPAPPPERSFALEVGGDLAPLFLPEYRDFFGSDVRLVAAGSAAPDGRTRLDTLRVEAAALRLDGSLTLAPDGLPESFDLTGRIAAAEGGPVRLPTSGTPVTVEDAQLSFTFDAAAGDAWTGEAALVGFESGGNRIGQVTLDAEGTIARGAEGDALDRRVTAQATIEAREIALADPKLAEAVGPTVSAGVALGWQEGEPLELSSALIQTETARVAIAGSLGSVEEGLPFLLRGSANLADLEPYAALADRPLGGRIVVSANGTVYLLDGRFDLRLGGVGRDLKTGIELLDRIIVGESKLALDARRDETGLLVRNFSAETAEAAVNAQGRVATGTTTLDATARLAEVGRLIEGLSGAATVEARVRETSPGTFDLALDASGPGGADVSFEGQLVEADTGALSADGRLTAAIRQLSEFSRVAKRPLGGAVTLEATGQAAITQQDFDLTVDLNGRDLSVGIPAADRLLGGELTLATALGKTGETLTLRSFNLSTRELTAALSGAVTAETGRIEGSARLRNVGLFAPDFAGPLSVEGAVSRLENARWGIDVRADGPGGITAAVTGSAAESGETVDLRVAGEAPLGLANASIAPRAVRGRAQFDLAMQGRPALGSLSGTITTSDARLIAPTYGVAVSGLGGTVRMGGAEANIDLSGAVEGGGRVSVGGSVGLSPPLAAALRVTLESARFTKDELFQTDVSGTVTIDGPLSGGARVGGVLDLGQTDVSVASTGLGARGDLPGLEHVNEPAAVRTTRDRAGLLKRDGDGGGAGGGRRPFALDLLIRAPNRIFIRGRGLDAELGGSLRLAGTTSNVIPQGQFDLIRGRLDILGRRLALDEGSARLEGSFDPYLRLVASTEAEGITVRIVVEGLASEPEIRFESSPELPQDEVLARLFFGRGLDELSPLQAARLASAVAQLAGRGGTDVVGRLRENFGLDDLDVTTDAEGNAAVRAGRYLSENVYTEVTVGSEGEADVSINLDLSQSLTVKGSVGSDGDTGLGIFFEKDY